MPNEHIWERAKEMFKILSYGTNLGMAARGVPTLEKSISHYSALFGGGGSGGGGSDQLLLFFWSSD